MTLKVPKTPSQDSGTEKILSVPKTPVRFLWFVTEKHKIWAFLATFAVLIAASLSQATNYFFKVIVDAVENDNLETALLFGLLYPFAILVVQLVYRFSGWMGMHWVTRTKKQTYDELTAYTLRHSHGYFSDRFAGSILSKVSNIVNAMESFITDFLWTHFNAFVSFVISFIFIFSVDRLSGLIFLILVIVLIWVNKRWAPKKRLLSRKTAETATRLRGSIVDAFTNAAAVRQYSRTLSEVKEIDIQSSENRDAQKSNWLYSERLMLWNSVILFLFASLMFYVLATRWSMGDITSGDFIFILALVSQITGTLIFIGRAINNTARVLGEADEGLSDLIIPYEVKDIENAQKLKIKDGQMEWKDVSFKFENNQVFRKFNITISPGERIGLVGPSGAGKTTFVSLLLRQHDIDGGEILIDDQNIAHVTQDSLRSAISVVPQEPLLFHRSVKDNIAYGKERATKKEVEDVAKMAEAHTFVTDLPNGYNTLVGERGVKLSGGQKQRVAIARAMLKDAPILVLDEATSALDSESEVAIQKALHKLMEGKTVVAIAHRLSTLREMDRILVLENGKIVEDGTHDALVKNGGTYARLWEHQAGGFLQD